MTSRTTAPAVGTTADTALRASHTVPCEAGQVHAVREFVGETLGDDPCAGVSVLLASELATNSVLHSSSRLGGSMTVTVSGVPDGTVRVEVADAGGLSMPALRGGPDGWDECGRGLHLVGDLSARWGYRIEPDGSLVTWFEVPRCRRNASWLAETVMTDAQCDLTSLNAGVSGAGLATDDHAGPDGNDGGPGAYEQLRVTTWGWPGATSRAAARGRGVAGPVGYRAAARRGFHCPAGDGPRA